MSKDANISKLAEKLLHHAEEMTRIMQELHNNNVNVSLKVINGYAGNLSKPSLVVTELCQVTDYLMGDKNS